MRWPDGASAIYSPGNEPYLGVPMLQQFDEMLVVLMEQNHKIGPWTRRNVLTAMQLAACELVPQTSSLLFGMRESIRQCYLLSAAVMIRPILERISTFSWLNEHPEGLELWTAGWLYGQRPSLKTRMESMGSTPTAPDDSGASVRDFLNSLVHGDPEAANMSAVFHDDGDVVYGVTKDTTSPNRASDLACQGAMYTIALLSRAIQCFPDAIGQSPAS